MRKELHLRSSTDFQRVRRHGAALLHPLLVMSYLPNGLEFSRFGFAVGRHIGKAVKRNRVKRRMRESVRLRIQRRAVRAGWDVVLVARRPVCEASYREVDQAVGLLLDRAGLSVTS